VTKDEFSAVGECAHLTSPNGIWHHPQWRPGSLDGGARLHPQRTPDGVYGVQECRLDLDPTLDSPIRYDLALISPVEESEERMLRRIQRAIEQQLGLHISRQTRLMDIVVLTVPDGPHRSAFWIGGNGCMGGFAKTWQLDKVAGVPPTLSDLQRGGAPFLLSLFRHLPAIGRGFNLMEWTAFYHSPLGF
jgi:hypothetical protein